MDIKKAAAALIASIILFNVTAYADVLGNLSTSGSWQTDMGGGAVYKHNEYTSSSVGKQTENYVEYTPNTEAVPIVVNGASVWGKRSMTSAANYMSQNGLRPLIGINADYFSFKTGIPMGYTIIDGKIYSKESGIQDAVGIRKDGTAFIDKIGISTSLSDNDKKIPIQYINKWAQDDFNWVYLLTEDFGSETHTSFDALYVICSPLSGELEIDTTMQLNVDEVFIYNGSIKIPPGKFVFVIDVDGTAEYVDMLSRLAPGDTLQLANSVYGAERYNWTEAEYAASTIGGRLINNGVKGGGFEAGAAPRTAVGIKSDGKVIFYTIDGRQTGHSYGCQLSTLASRMVELGCIDAINFDGGGSTMIGAVFPGSEQFKVSNKPSDGAQRSVANFLFLKDLRELTNDPWYVTWNMPANHNYLAGVGVSLTPTAVYDTGNYKMDGLRNVDFTVSNTGGAESTVDENGYVILKGSGKTIVSVTGRAYSKDFSFQVYEDPDELRVTDEATGRKTDSLTVPKGGMVNYDLEVGAYVNGIRLEAYPSLFRWEIDGTLGTVNEDGVVTIKDDGSGSAVLRVSAGGVRKDIPISVVKTDTFKDIAGHWAHDVIESMADKGIINGIERDGQMFFMPDSRITRIQFAAIMAKALGLDADEYSSTRLDFTDAGAIQPWAVSYVKAMVSCGYITGKSDDDGKTVYFDPDASITRAEAFAILERSLGLKNRIRLDYADTDQIPAWAAAAFEKLAAVGVIRGFEDGSIKPNGLATRAEAAVLIDKAFN